VLFLRRGEWEEATAKQTLQPTKASDGTEVALKPLGITRGLVPAREFTMTFRRI
jgi:hypothetical protein